MQYFSTISHKWHDLWSKIQIGLHAKYLLFLSDFNEMTFLGRYLKNTQIQNFTKIRPVGAELFHADRHDEANSHFPLIMRARLKTNISINNARNNGWNIKDSKYYTFPSIWFILRMETREIKTLNDFLLSRPTKPQRCCAFVGLDNKLYKKHGTYIKTVNDY